MQNEDEWDPSTEREVLEYQIARNEAFIFELEKAHEQLRVQAKLSYLATAFCFTIAFALGSLFIAPTRGSSIFLQTLVGQTVVTTLIALAFAGIAAAFFRFAALRGLAEEAQCIARANRYAVEAARVIAGMAG